MKEKLTKSLNNETRKTNLLIMKQGKLLYITTANYQT
jgi:hypothetical protein